MCLYRCKWVGVKINILNVGNVGLFWGVLVFLFIDVWEGVDGKMSRWVGLGIVELGKGGEEIKVNWYKW